MQEHRELNAREFRALGSLLCSSQALAEAGVSDLAQHKSQVFTENTPPSSHFLHFEGRSLHFYYMPLPKIVLFAYIDVVNDE